MREVRYTTRFQRDHKREKFGRYSKKLDDLLMDVVNLLAADALCRDGILITHYRANGTITATATSGPISFSSTASPMTTASNSCALAHMASLVCEDGGTRHLRDITLRYNYSGGSRRYLSDPFGSAAGSGSRQP
jgi:hypothetical protein